MTVGTRESGAWRYAPTSPLSRVRNWPMWRTPAKPLTLILAVEALCVTCLLLANVKSTANGTDYADFTLLFALSAVFAEAVERIERLRQIGRASCRERV